MAFKYSRVDAPLLSDKTIELGHHILKAHIYKNISKQRGYSSRDMQAYWMALSADNLNAALVCHRNLFSPNVKVRYCYTRLKKSVGLEFCKLPWWGNG